MLRFRPLIAAFAAPSLAILALAPACYTGDGSGATGGVDSGGGPCTQIPMPDGGAMQVTGQVVQAGDASPPKGIPNAQVAVEYGGLYVTWCDLSHASPYYVFGAYTDANGNFT